MNRRDLLKAAPAAVLAGAVPVAAMDDSPIKALFREWLAHSDWLNGPAADRLPDEVFNALLDDSNALMDKLVNEPARDLQDLCLKLLLVTNMGEEVLYNGVPGADLLPAEARALIGTIA